MIRNVKKKSKWNGHKSQKKCMRKFYAKENSTITNRKMEKKKQKNEKP